MTSTTTLLISAIALLFSALEEILASLSSLGLAVLVSRTPLVEAWPIAVEESDVEVVVVVVVVLVLPIVSTMNPN